MGRRLSVALLAAFAVLVATLPTQSPRAQSRVFAATKEGELTAEIPASGDWCRPDVTFTIRGTDDSYFTTGETDAQGRRARFLLNTLLGTVRYGLGKECPQAKSVTFNGFVDDAFVYRGYASRDNPEGAWVLLDMPVALVDVPPTPPQPAVASNQPAPPRQEAIGECDTLAAHPDDPGKPRGTAGVSDDDLNAGAALRACEEALRASPDTPRLKYQLARASLLYDRHAEGVELMTDAAEAGHGAALAALGDFALYGVLDDDSDPETAKALYERAAEAGFKPAARLAAEIVANPKEDTSQTVPQEPEYHYPERMEVLLKGETLPGDRNTFVRTVVYSINALAGIKYQCPDAGLNALSPFNVMNAVSRRMGGGLNGFFGLAAMSEGNFPELEQAAMDDGYALAFTKGCQSREVAAVQDSLRRTFQ